MHSKNPAQKNPQPVGAVTKEFPLQSFNVLMRTWPRGPLGLLFG